VVGDLFHSSVSATYGCLLIKRAGTLRNAACFLPLAFYLYDRRGAKSSVGVPMVNKGMGLVYLPLLPAPFPGVPPFCWF